MTEAKIPGIYKDGVIKPLGNLDLDENSEVTINFPEKEPDKVESDFLSLYGCAKNLVSVEEMEQIIKEVRGCKHD